MASAVDRLDSTGRRSATPRATETAPAAEHTLPLAADELEGLFDKFQIPHIGRKRIQHMRVGLAARATRTSRYAGKLRYPSELMGFALETDAFDTEFVAIVEWHHDDGETLEIYCQPDAGLKIAYRHHESGRTVTTPTTPDVFRITRTGFVITECKTEPFLLKEKAKGSHRYIQQADGSWRSPCGEAAAGALGCQFEVRSSKQNNYVAFQNVELLADYYRSDSLPDTPAEVLALFAERLRGKPFESAYSLIHVEPRINADHLYTMLVRGEIYFPIDALRLTDQDTALFFRREAEWHAHKTFLKSDRPEKRVNALRTDFRAKDTFDWNGVVYEIVNPGADVVTARTISGEAGTLLTLSTNDLSALVGTEIQFHNDHCEADSGEATRRYREASPKQLQEAVWRYQILFGTPDGKNELASRGPRIRFDWQRAYRQAEERWGNGFLGLLPNRNGNRSAKTSAAGKGLALEVIAMDWETIRRKGRLLSFGKYKNLGDEKGTACVSYGMFCKYIKQRSGYEQSKARVGEKGAYEFAEQYLELEPTTPRHGTHSWHIGHIDHTPLPLKFLYSNGGELADTIWLTFLTGAFDRKIRAYYLSFDEPSYRSCMMVIRDCVRRHGRVHQVIVTDGGSEFQSVYYEKLLARLVSTKRERLRGKPRHGSVCERIFGTTQNQFVTCLLGATDIVEKHFRAISPEVDPRRHAIWVLDLFDAKFERYIEEQYHTNFHSGLDMSPNQAEALSLTSHGHRSFRRIPYDVSVRRTRLDDGEPFSLRRR